MPTNMGRTITQPTKYGVVLVACCCAPFERLEARHSPYLFSFQFVQQIFTGIKLFRNRLIDKDRLCELQSII